MTLNLPRSRRGEDAIFTPHTGFHLATVDLAVRGRGKNRTHYQHEAIAQMQARATVTDNDFEIAAIEERRRGPWPKFTHLAGSILRLLGLFIGAWVARQDMRIIQTRILGDILIGKIDLINNGYWVLEGG
ncbi:hypothetical protein MMC29_006341 [Sticta canariensis]|nr:hypothetical protein [Sticta canariensis]